MVHTITYSLLTFIHSEIGQQYVDVVKAFGGKCVAHVSERLTHYIAHNAKAAHLLAARLLGVTCVSPLWLEACIDRDEKVQEREFAVFSPIEDVVFPLLKGEALPIEGIGSTIKFVPPLSKLSNEQQKQQFQDPIPNKVAKTERPIDSPFFSSSQREFSAAEVASMIHVDHPISAITSSKGNKNNNKNAATASTKGKSSPESHVPVNIAPTSTSSTITSSALRNKTPTPINWGTDDDDTNYSAPKSSSAPVPVRAASAVAAEVVSTVPIIDLTEISQNNAVTIVEQELPHQPLQHQESQESEMQPMVMDMEYTQAAVVEVPAPITQKDGVEATEQPEMEVTDEVQIEHEYYDEPYVYEPEMVYEPEHDYMPDQDYDQHQSEMIVEDEEYIPAREPLSLPPISADGSSSTVVPRTDVPTESSIGLSASSAVKNAIAAVASRVHIQIPKFKEYTIPIVDPTAFTRRRSERLIDMEDSDEEDNDHDNDHDTFDEFDDFDFDSDTTSYKSGVFGSNRKKSAKQQQLEQQRERERSKAKASKPDREKKEKEKAIRDVALKDLLEKSKERAIAREKRRAETVVTTIEQVEQFVAEVEASHEDPRSSELLPREDIMHLPGASELPVFYVDEPAEAAMQRYQASLIEDTTSDIERKLVRAHASLSSHHNHNFHAGSGHHSSSSVFGAERESIYAVPYYRKHHRDRDRDGERSRDRSRDRERDRGNKSATKTPKDKDKERESTAGSSRGKGRKSTTSVAVPDDISSVGAASHEKTISTVNLVAEEEAPREYISPIFSNSDLFRRIKLRASNAHANANAQPPSVGVGTEGPPPSINTPGVVTLTVSPLKEHDASSDIHNIVNVTSGSSSSEHRPIRTDHEDVPMMESFDMAMETNEEEVHPVPLSIPEVSTAIEDLTIENEEMPLSPDDRFLANSKDQKMIIAFSGFNDDFAEMVGITKVILQHIKDRFNNPDDMLENLEYSAHHDPLERDVEIIEDRKEDYRERFTHLVIADDKR